VKYRPIEARAPIEEDALKGLVAGGVEGLSAQNIEVIMVPSRRSLKPLKPPAMGQVGPITVATGSKTFLQILIALMGSVIMALAAGVAVFIARSRG
jgi:type III secretory pathway lipoprotein EscJ